MNVQWVGLLSAIPFASHLDAARFTNTYMQDCSRKDIKADWTKTKRMANIDKKRVEIWSALSDLFCDTEPNYFYIARVLKGIPIEYLKHIFFEEVAPVCGSNLMTPIPPVWSGFDEQQLADNIMEMLDRNERSFIARAVHATASLFMRFWFRSLWLETEERLNYYWARPVPQPRQLASLAFEAALHEEKIFQDFFPGAAGRSVSSITSFPDLILVYFNQCVALGMDYQEHPEHLTFLFKRAARGICMSLGEFQSPHINGLLETLGASVAGAGGLLAQGSSIWPETIASLARLIASGRPTDEDGEGDVSMIECYLVVLDADSSETDDWAIIMALLRFVSDLDGVPTPYDEATLKAQRLAMDALAKIRGSHGISEENSWLKEELSRWEFVPHASRIKVALALYYKSLNLLERY